MRMESHISGRTTPHSRIAMQLLPFLALALALAVSAVSAHTIAQRLTINGELQPLQYGMRVPGVSTVCSNPSLQIIMLMRMEAVVLWQILVVIHAQAGRYLHSSICL
jgi:hypothetical protein